MSKSAGTVFQTVMPWASIISHHTEGSRRWASPTSTSAPPAASRPKMSKTDRSKCSAEGASAEAVALVQVGAGIERAPVGDGDPLRCARGAGGVDDVGGVSWVHGGG